jgi:hypothetical protein
MLRKYSILMIKIVTTDFQVYRTDQLVMFLNQCLVQKRQAVIDIHLEGPCCKTIGLYQLLDEFCNSTGFEKSQIKIITANLIESHPDYQIECRSRYWYEVQEIHNWLKKHCYQHTFLPTKHFGNFIGRSTWYRVWIGSQLYKWHRDKTLQTFHSSFSCNYVVPPEHGVFDTLELDYLNQFGCNDMQSVIEFLNDCPLIIDPANITKAQQIKGYIPATNNQCYPLQHPANLMLEDYYCDIFVDIVCETKILGKSFFLTEKTWRPIIFKRPIILMSSINTLKNLKRLGFKTFDQWWDEGYDDYSDQDRVREILKLVDTLSKWSVDQCHQTLIEMQDVLDHNYQVFCNLTYSKIDQLLNNE